MSIQGVGNNQPLQRVVSQPVLRQVQGKCSDCDEGKDKVELSGDSPVSQLKSSDIRTDKVADIKARIEAGTYEDDQKLDTAIERLLDKLNA